MPFLLHNIIHFTRVLHDLGLDVPAARSVELTRALSHVDVGRRADFYHTLRTLLVHRPQDLPVFDEAFRVFWRPPPGDWTTTDLRAMGERRRTGAPRVETPATDPAGEEDTSPPKAGMQRIAAESYSGREALKAKDFERYTPTEIAEARRMMSELRWEIGQRRTRRWMAGAGGPIDLGRVIRANMRYGAEPVVLPTRVRKDRRRPLVLLCDVSGSMERYSRMLLHFLYCVAGRLDRVEAFLFSTQLTRVTRELERRSVDEVFPRLPRRLPDYAGGTRIGEALATFNRTWARRVLGHGAVVLLISDGWDRGDPVILACEMARLHRTAHRLIWLNPLLGSPDYAPLTRGMQAALPHIDDFLPVHNLTSLETLAEHLNALPARRSGYPSRRVWTSPRPIHSPRQPRPSGIS